MKKRSLCSIAAAIALLASSASAQAVGFTNSFGLSNPRSVVTFDGHVFPTLDLYEITDQYLPQGIRFSPNLWQFGGPAPVGNGLLSNFDYGINLDFTLKFGIYFTTPVTAAALQISSNYPYAMTAFLGNAPVGQHIFVGAQQTTDAFAGFVAMPGTSFDRLQLDSGGDLFFAAFDNVQFTTTPEPSTFAVLGIGLLAIAGAGRRRRRTAQLAESARPR